MHPFCRTFYPIILLCFLVAGAHLRAQQEDIRISPPSFPEYNLDSTALIQGAARIGDATLVVWGSNRTGANGVLVNALYHTVVRRSSGAGDVRQVIAERGIPSTFIRVFPLPDRFIVFWRDERSDAPGLYMRMIDTAGNPMGEERALDTGDVFELNPEPMYLFGAPARGMALFWNRKGERAGIYHARLDRHGEVVGGGGTRVGGSIMFEPRVASLPGIRIVKIDGVARALREDGRIDDRPIQAPLNSVYHLGADTSIAVLRTEALLIYRSLFDSLPGATYNLPIGAFEKNDAAGLARDSAAYHAGFIGVSWNSSGMGIVTRPYGVSVMSDGTISELTLGGDSLAFSSQENPIEIRSITVQRGCDNTYRYGLRYKRWTHYTHGTISDTGAVTYTSDGSDALPRHSGPFSASCDPRWDVPVHRVSKATLSTVAVEIEGERVTLAAPIVPLVNRYPARYPSVHMKEHRLYVTWEGVVAPSITPRYVIARWGEGSDSTILAAMLPEPLERISSGGIYEGSWEDHRDEAVQLDGASLVVSRWTRRDNYRSSGGNPYYGIAARSTIYRGVGEKWVKGIAVMGDNSNRLGRFDLPVATHTYDPNTTQVFGFASFYGNDLDVRASSEIFALDDEGKQVWSATLDSAITGVAIPIGIGLRECLLIVGNHVRRVRGSRVDTSFEFATNRPEARYVRLLGDGFLRFFPEDSMTRAYMFESYRLDGALRATKRIEFAAPVSEIFIVQNRTDSTIALIHARDGVRVSFLHGRTLAPGGHEVLVSAVDDGVSMPAGLFRNDSLFVVWEDRRGGELQIYGRGWNVADDLLPHPSSDSVAPPDTVDDPGIPPHDPPSSDAVLRVIRAVPIPAVTAVRFDLDLVAPGVLRVELYDPLGRRVQAYTTGDLPAGHVAWDCSVGELRPGVYTVVLHDPSGRTASSRILVLH